MNPKSIIVLLLGFADGLRFRELFFLILGLFLLDLIIPDMIPMIDEVLLGLLAVLLANIKKDHSGEDQHTIEGEIIDHDDTS